MCRSPDETTSLGVFEHPFVTVAICTYNRTGLLEKTIAALLPQLTAGAELLVVDNASTDRTAELLTKLAGHPSLRVCREEKLGLSVARNTALIAARGEYVIFLDDDAVPQAGWLASYRRLFRTRAVGGAGGGVEPEFEITPPPWLWLGAGRVRERGQDRICTPVENPWGCNFAVRRETAIAIGGFIPGLGHCGNEWGGYEEVELLNRIRQAGHEIWWTANAGVRHFVEAKRLRMSWQLISAFRMGGHRAIRRLDALPNPGSRMVFIVSRVLIAPFHCLANLMLAAVSFPFRRGAVAARALVHMASISGLTFKLLAHSFNR